MTNTDIDGQSHRSPDNVTEQPFAEDGHEADVHPRFPGHRPNGRCALANTEAVTHGGRRRQPIVKGNDAAGEFAQIPFDMV